MCFTTHLTCVSLHISYVFHYTSRMCFTTHLTCVSLHISYVFHYTSHICFTTHLVFVSLHISHVFHYTSHVCFTTHLICVFELFSRAKKKSPEKKGRDTHRYHSSWIYSILLFYEKKNKL